MTSVPVCVEMYDGQSFCGDGDAYDGVAQQEWHFVSSFIAAQCGRAESASVAAVMKADCAECLRRLVLLGKAAENRLAQPK